MNKRKGVSIIEFSLAGIPAIFIIISTFEMGLGMWQYHTLAFTMKEATRYSTSHGEGCLMTGNSCSITIGNISSLISDTAIGIPASQLNVTFTTESGAVQTCAPLNTCFSSSVVWPPNSNSDNAQGKSVTIAGTFTLHSALAMFWPGTHGADFNTVSFTSSSTQQIMF